MKLNTIQLEILANQQLDIASNKDAGYINYSNRAFFNTIILFQGLLMDKLYTLQESDGMDFEERLNMAEKCGKDLRKFIHTYTGLDTHEIENFL